ncbi:MAG TPA: radical SAM protein, partial [Methylomirabilota bacterium]|nr:radical SAM protein [Methylomirabilota bacterium]
MNRSAALSRHPSPRDPSAHAFAEAAFDQRHADGLGGSAVDADRRRGRGAGVNPSGRYEPEARIGFDDGWGSADELPPLKTTVTTERARTIITRNESPDLSFDRSINPYRGCEHG